MGEGWWRHVPILHVIEPVRFTLGNLRLPLLMNCTMGTGRPSDSCGTFQDARARLCTGAHPFDMHRRSARANGRLVSTYYKARGNPAMVSSAS